MLRGIGDGNVFLAIVFLRFVKTGPGTVIPCGGGNLVGVGLLVLAIGVVQDDGALMVIEVQALALSTAGIQAATGKKVGAGLWGQADDGAVDALAVRGGIGLVFEDVLRAEVVDVVGVIVAGACEVSVVIGFVVAPVRLLHAHGGGHGGGLGQLDVVADVVKGGGGDVQATGDVDGGAVVVHEGGYSGGVAVAVQASADGGITGTVDQGGTGVTQGVSAHV